MIDAVVGGVLLVNIYLVLFNSRLQKWHTLYPSKMSPKAWVYRVVNSTCSSKGCTPGIYEAKQDQTTFVFVFLVDKTFCGICIHNIS